MSACEVTECERKSGTGAVTLSAAGGTEGGREKDGGQDSIKPTLAGKLFGILHFFFFSEFSWAFVPVFAPRKDTIHDLRNG